MKGLADAGRSVVNELQQTSSPPEPPPGERPKRPAPEAEQSESA
jgi:hypothetical protein